MKKRVDYSKMLSPAPEPKNRGTISMDNPRENIDPHVKSKVIDAQEIVLGGVRRTTWPEAETDHSALDNLSFAASGHTGFEPAKGTDDNFVTDAEKAMIEQRPGQTYVLIDPWMYTAVVAGTWAFTIDGGLVNCAGFLNSGSHAVNDELDFKIFVPVGTYTIRVIHYQHTNRGIATFYFDGDLLGTVDMYGADTRNVVEEITSISVTTAGFKTLKMKVTGKNASSSDYYIVPSAIALLRTA